jgi:hypothetical protein
MGKDCAALIAIAELTKEQDSLDQDKRVFQCL